MFHCKTYEFHAKDYIANCTVFLNFPEIF
jgi:hypothetical protein